MRILHDTLILKKCIGAKTHTFWTNLTTRFTQLLPKQNTDFVHFIYWINILNWPLNLALLHGNKKALPCQSTDRAHWFNGVNEHSKCKHATIRQHWQRSDRMAYRHRQIDSALGQWCWGSSGAAVIFQGDRSTLHHNLATMLCQYVRSLAPLQLVAP